MSSAQLPGDNLGTIGNAPTPARLAIGVVGAGRVGRAFGRSLEHSGHVVVAASTRTPESALTAAALWPDAAVVSAPDVAARAELLIIAVPDDALAGVVAAIAPTVNRSAIVFHTSGAHGVAPLEPLVERGCTVMALHPAMTFTGGDADLERLTRCTVAVTAADEVELAVGQALAIELGAEPVLVAESDRVRYHAALTHAANHLVTLLADARSVLDSILSSHGYAEEPNDRTVGARVLEPLVTAAMENALADGIAALTGPIARGDLDTVAAHRDQLTAIDPGLGRFYRAAGTRTAELADIPPRTAAAVRVLLAEPEPR